jgi:hypothetical protein
MVPNFLTVNDSGSIRPLTTAQKYNVVTRTAFDWYQFGWYTAKSGIDQWHGNEAGYGNGIHGYGKRWASNFADGTAEITSSAQCGPRYSSRIRAISERRPAASGRA